MIHWSVEKNKGINRASIQEGWKWMELDRNEGDPVSYEKDIERKNKNVGESLKKK